MDTCSFWKHSNRCAADRVLLFL
ncbi:hypothetical protein ACWF5S_04455 [Peribacillus butanolivorans]